MAPCEWIKDEKTGAVIHINRGRGSKRLVCRFCNRSYNRDDGKLCDYPVAAGKTCDAPMCAACSTCKGGQATDMGNGLKKLNDTVDYCPDHKDS